MALGPHTNATPGSPSTRHANIRRPTTDEQAIIDSIEDARNSALKKAIKIADDLISRKTKSSAGGFQSIDGDVRTILAINRWTYTTQIASPFWETLEKARGLMKKNLDLGKHQHWVDTTSPAHAYAAPDESPNLFLCLNGFFKDNTQCQKEVLVHEYFHWVYLSGNHYYSTKKTEEALKCPHHMSMLVWDLATGLTGGCANAEVCRKKPNCAA